MSKIALLHEVLQLTRPLIGVDLETTGTDPRNSGICEMALEIMVPGHPVKEYRTLINPMLNIPDHATKIHGITNAMVRDAPTFRQLAHNLLTGMTNCDFAGYNVFFDLRQMLEEFKRAGIAWDYEDASVIDGFRIWQIVEQRTLEHAVERWLGPSTSSLSDDGAAPDVASGERQDKAHTAMFDLRNSTRVIAAQLLAKPELPRTVRELHCLQWPDRFDAEGKLRWKDGALCLTFGEHKDKPLQRVPASYFNWMLKKDFSEKVKGVLRDAMLGKYPTPPAADIEDPDDEETSVHSQDQ